MSDHPGKQKLEELVAGLEGVTPGPWYADRVFVRDDNDDHTVAECPDGPSYANAAHIARCDPDTIRSISDAYKAMEEQLDDCACLFEVFAESAEARGDNAERAMAEVMAERARNLLGGSRHEG